MLVLTRKKGESVFVGDAEIVLISQKGNAIQLGFKAPSGVRIMRGELIAAESKSIPERQVASGTEGEARTSGNSRAVERRAG